MKTLCDVDLFLFALDGPVYIGDNEIAGAFAAVNERRSRGRKVCFFTNNSSRKHPD